MNSVTALMTSHNIVNLNSTEELQKGLFKNKHRTPDRLGISIKHAEAPTVLVNFW
jgi:hypothetical protein